MEKTYLARARVCRVASVDRRGMPHTAPLCHAFDRVRRVVYVDRARRLLKRKFKQYRDTDFDSVIALHVEAVTSWGL